MRILLTLFAVLGMTAPALAQEAGLEGPGVYRWKGDGLRIETQALVHDQVRGFFTGRGFGDAGLDVLVNEGCFFRSSIGNEATNPKAPHITINQSEWRIFVDGEERKLRTRADWLPVWDRLGVDVEQRVAFKWALFPTTQEFAPNDYNWGMITYGLAPGTRFDLELVWHQGGEKRTMRFEGMECAKQ
ncbi:MAG: hypothetical protein OQK24_03065 [Magnetovibrio sp.]|nr:hypothetical protein [Magnetovibrio sp.]